MIKKDPNRELEFPYKLEDWETKVFKDYDYFTVYRFYGLGSKDKQEFKSFPEAIEAAKGDRKALVYVISKAGRSVVCVKNRWDEYMNIWNEMNAV